MKIPLLASLLILPVLGAYKGFGYEQIKVLFFIVSISLIGFLNLKLKFRWSPIAKIGGIFILILLITYLIWIQFQNQSVVHLIYFWLLAGIIDQTTKLGA